MQLIRKTIKLGNSSGVLLPKSLLGSEVKITVLNRPINIKKKVLKILEKELEEIIGIYILNKEPHEILAVSEKIKKIIYNEKIRIMLVPLDLIKKDLKIKEDLKKKILNAEAILNKALLSELRKIIALDKFSASLTRQKQD